MHGDRRPQSRAMRPQAARQIVGQPQRRHRRDERRQQEGPRPVAHEGIRRAEQPEEERRLVGVQLVAAMREQPVAAVPHLLGDEHEARFVRGPRRAQADARAEHDARRWRRTRTARGGGRRSSWPAHLTSAACSGVRKKKPSMPSSPGKSLASRAGFAAEAGIERLDNGAGRALHEGIDLRGVLFGAGSNTSRTAAFRRARASSTRRRAGAPGCRAADSRSVSRRCSSTSGWRRTMPVAEHGASSRIASKGTPSHHVSGAAASAASNVRVRADAQARMRFVHAAQALRIDVEREQLQRRIAFEQVRGLAAGRRARIEHARTLRRRQRIGDALRAAVLHRDQAFGETRQFAHRQPASRARGHRRETRASSLRCRRPAIARGTPRGRCACGSRAATSARGSRSRRTRPPPHRPNRAARACATTAGHAASACDLRATLRAMRAAAAH